MAGKKIVSIDSKKRGFFIIVTVLLPFALLALLEIFLRIFNYGPDLSLFHKETLNDIEYFTLNSDVGRRYFHQVEFTPDVSPDIFSVVKPEGSYRIFCLGASTTAGYPYWYNGSFSVFLRDRMQAMFPGKNLEVINLGLTATNSFSVVDIAQELPQYQPDLFIVYDGHNEFYGAFGAGSRESLGSSRLTAKLYLRMIHLRTFVLIRNIFTSITNLFASSELPQARGTTMERLARGQYIPYNSDVYSSALETFKENLNELNAISSKHHIPMILSSQVSNLRDLPPFISGELPGDVKKKQNYRKEFERGTFLLNGGKIDSALIHFQRLLSYDSLRAEVHFSIARCLEQSGRKAEANSEYLKARDYDQLRFRTSSEFNNALRNMCDGKTVFFLDMERIFKELSPDSLIGNQLIFEHLHPNARGYFLMAKAMVQSMREHALFASAAEWNSIPAPDEDSLWRQRKVSSFDDRLALRKVEILTAAWPFSNQTVPVVSSIGQDDTLGIIVESITRNRSNWVTAHQKSADFFHRRKDFVSAAKEYETVIAMFPHDVQHYLKAGRIYLDMGDLDKVKKIMTTSLQLKKTMLAYRVLGDIALREKRPEDAIQFYRDLTSFDQNLKERLENGYFLALAYSQSGKTEQARTQLLSLLQLQPDFTPAAVLLSNLQKK